MTTLSDRAPRQPRSTARRHREGSIIADAVIERNARNNGIVCIPESAVIWHDTVIYRALRQPTEQRGAASGRVRLVEDAIIGKNAASAASSASSTNRPPPRPTAKAGTSETASSASPRAPSSGMTPLSDRAPPAPKHRPPASGRVRLVEDAIIGKNARIGRNVRIINEPAATEADGEGWYIRDGIVCIPKAPSLGCHR